MEISQKGVFQEYGAKEPKNTREREIPRTIMRYKMGEKNWHHLLVEMKLKQASLSSPCRCSEEEGEGVQAETLYHRDSYTLPM